MGSGHILVYAFDVLVQIYGANGISQRDAAQSILQHNLYGLDIDDRAAQLAYFAVMMKARQYDRRIFSRNTQPHLYALQNSQPMHEEAWGYFGDEEPIAHKLWDTFQNAKEFGSLLPLDVTLDDLAKLRVRLAEMDEMSSMGNLATMAFVLQAVEIMQPLVEMAAILLQKYHVVVTNPPYMGSSNMSKSLADFVKKHYPDSKSDLFAVFIQKCIIMTEKNGYCSLVTMHSWMFLSSFENLRKHLLKNLAIININHLGMEAFENIIGKVVSTAAFVLLNLPMSEYKLQGVRLVDYYDSKRYLKESAYFNEENLYTAQQSNFSKIPGSPVAYWVSDTVFKDFQDGIELGDIAFPRQGLATGDNERFLRGWFEPKYDDIGFHFRSVSDFHDSGNKYAPYNKGGQYRKWFGNRELVIRFDQENYAILQSQGNHLPSRQFYFSEGINWSALTSGNFSARYCEKGFVFDTKGSSCFFRSEKELLFLFACLNSNTINNFLNIISPTLDFNCGSVAKVPILEIENNGYAIDECLKCIKLSRSDWDSFETSWDFQQDPIVRYSRDLRDAAAIGAKMNVSHDGTKQSFHSPIELAYLFWKGECNQRFRELKKNEEELNRIFIDIYGLQDELTPEVADKDVTVYCVYDTKEDFPESLSDSNYVLTKRDVIVNFISYAVGCMFGRYSLYNDRILYAGGGFGDFGSLVEKIQDHLHAQGKSYFTEKEFYPDSDNIIPICDDEYFDDDVTGRFVKFVETVFGEDSLEDNLQFIADALGGKGTSREIIRNYFLKDFFADHCKKYKKRPIYWLFDSGKKNGFKALIYMHRYQSDLLARMRTDYVHEQQERYRTQLAHIDEAIQQASGSERVKLTKQQKKLQDQSLEIQKYEEKIHHLADQNIVIDLDDGVKHNYALFADVLAKIK